MAFPFKKILVPADFDESSLRALQLAGQIAQQNDGEVFVVRIVPVDIDVSGMPQYVDLIKRQEGIDRDRLVAIARQRLPDVKWDIVTKWAIQPRSSTRLRNVNPLTCCDGHTRQARPRAPHR